MEMMTPRVRMVLGTVLVVLCVSGALIGLTLGLYEQPPPYGGGPPDEDVAPQAGHQARSKRVARDLPRDLPEFGSSGRLAKGDRVNPSASGAPFNSEYRTFTTTAVTTDTHNCSQIAV